MEISILGAGVLCWYSEQESKNHSGIYLESAQRGLDGRSNVIK